MIKKYRCFLKKSFCNKSDKNINKIITLKPRYVDQMINLYLSADLKKNNKKFLDFMKKYHMKSGNIVRNVLSGYTKNDKKDVHNNLTDYVEDAVEEIVINKTLDSNITNENYIGEYYHEIELNPYVKNLIETKTSFFLSDYLLPPEYSQGILEALYLYQELMRKYLKVEKCYLPFGDLSSVLIETVFSVYEFYNKKKKILFISDKVNTMITEVIKNYVSENENIVLKIINQKDFYKEKKKYEDKNEFIFAFINESPDKNGFINNDLNQIFKNQNDKNDFKTILITDFFSNFIKKTNPTKFYDFCVGSGQKLGVPLSISTGAAFLTCKEKNFSIINANYVEKKNNFFRLKFYEEDIIFKNGILLSPILNLFYILEENKNFEIISKKIYFITIYFTNLLTKLGIEIENPNNYFGKFVLKTRFVDEIIKNLDLKNINIFKRGENTIEFSFDENKTDEDIINLINIIKYTFKSKKKSLSEEERILSDEERILDMEENILDKEENIQKIKDFEYFEFYKVEKTNINLKKFFQKIEKKNISILDSINTLDNRNFLPYKMDLLLNEKLNIVPYINSKNKKGIYELLLNLSSRILNYFRMEIANFSSPSEISAIYSCLVTIKNHMNSENQNRKKILIEKSLYKKYKVICDRLNLELIYIDKNDDNINDISHFEKLIKMNENNLLAFIYCIPNKEGIWDKNTEKMCKIAKSIGCILYLDGSNLYKHWGRQLSLFHDITHINFSNFFLPVNIGNTPFFAILYKKKLNKNLPSHQYFNSICFDRNFLYSSSNDSKQLSDLPYSSVGYLIYLGFNLRTCIYEDFHHIFNDIFFNNLFFMNLVKDYFSIKDCLWDKNGNLKKDGKFTITCTVIDFNKLGANFLKKLKAFFLEKNVILPQDKNGCMSFSISTSESGARIEEYANLLITFKKMYDKSKKK